MLISWMSSNYAVGLLHAHGHPLHPLVRMLLELLLCSLIAEHQRHCNTFMELVSKHEQLHMVTI